jgi:hypothetical protein
MRAVGGQAVGAGTELSRRTRVRSVLPVVLLGCLCAAAAADSPCSGDAQRVGGCRTSAREYGLPSFTDSLGVAAIRGLLTPSTAPRAGEACLLPPGTAPLFAQLGAVDHVADSLWRAMAEQVTVRLRESGLALAQRSALLHTTGPCFPPLHIDFQAYGDSARVIGFLDSLRVSTWTGFEIAAERRRRDLFLAAGMSLQLMEWVIDLTWKTP